MVTYRLLPSLVLAQWPSSFQSVTVVLHELLYTASQGVIKMVKMVLLEDLLFPGRDDTYTQNEVAQ